MKTIEGLKPLTLPVAAALRAADAMPEHAQVEAAPSAGFGLFPQETSPTCGAPAAGALDAPADPPPDGAGAISQQLLESCCASDAVMEGAVKWAALDIHPEPPDQRHGEPGVQTAFGVTVEPHPDDCFVFAETLDEEQPWMFPAIWTAEDAPRSPTVLLSATGSTMSLQPAWPISGADGPIEWNDIAAPPWSDVLLGYVLPDSACQDRAHPHPPEIGAEIGPDAGVVPPARPACDIPVPAQAEWLL